LCCTFGRGGVGSDTQGRIDIGQTVCVSSDDGNPKALTVKLMGKGPANAAAGAGDQNNSLHVISFEAGVNK
jgi:hypothetical protein